MFKQFITLTLLAATLAGCTAAASSTASTSTTPKLGDTLMLQGKLVLKGSAPMVYPVLLLANDQWELQNVPAEVAATLQNREVSAEGTVTRATSTGLQLPSLHVTKIVPMLK